MARNKKVKISQYIDLLSSEGSYYIRYKLGQHEVVVPLSKYEAAKLTEVLLDKLLAVSLHVPEVSKDEAFLKSIGIKF